MAAGEGEQDRLGVEAPIPEEAPSGDWDSERDRTSPATELQDPVTSAAAASSSSPQAPEEDPATDDEAASATSEAEPGEVTSEKADSSTSPRPSETDQGASAAPPLPTGPPPGADDGWEYHWDPTHQAYFFFNRFTQQTTWENPRVPTAADEAGPSAAEVTAAPSALASAAGGYNPAIHGDYDPNAWYAQGSSGGGAVAEEDGGLAAAAALQVGPDGEPLLPDPSLLFVAGGTFNRRTGNFQTGDEPSDKHGDEAKSRRQMNAYFDVDAAANAHNGRSLRAERASKKLTKTELKQFKEKRRAKKEEKRRAWLRD